MQPIVPFRRVILPLVAALTFLFASAPLLHAGPRGQVVRPQPEGRPRAFGAPRQVPPPNPRREHLPEWMARHSNLSPQEQQRALENEPGFHNLPPQTQQRLRNQLALLSRMAPEQRSRLLQRNEAMERLTPQQRQQFNGALGRLGALPPDRRRLVARAERDLREMPPAQRQAMLNSGRMRSEFTEGERSTLSDLLAVEPYIPVQPQNDGTVVGH